MNDFFEMEPDHKVLVTFADQGQDFLWWIIDVIEGGRTDQILRGKIVDCGPFQFSTWTQYEVRNSVVRSGSFINIARPGSNELFPIKYHLVGVEIIHNDAAQNIMDTF